MTRPWWMPSSWERAFRLLAREAPDLILAGGALRDGMLGRPVKDLDFFANAGKVPGGAGNVDKFRWSDDLLVALGVDRVERLGAEIADEEYRGKVHRLWRGREMWANVIFQPWADDEPMTFTDIFDTFDIGLCMVAWRPGAPPIRHWCFDRDVHDRTISCFESVEKKHVARVARKYPDWRIVDRTMESALDDPRQVRGDDRDHRGILFG